MKNTGIIRKVDELGRIVIPIEIRNQFNIIEKDLMEIYAPRCMSNFILCIIDRKNFGKINNLFKNKLKKFLQPFYKILYSYK